MRASVTTHSRGFDEQERHRHSEGIQQSDENKYEFDQIENIVQEFPRKTNMRNREAYDYPTIHITTVDEETHTFESATVTLSETDPEVDIWMVRDEAASREFSRVVHFTGYGIHAETHTNKFGKSYDSHTMLIKGLNGKITNLGPCNYRGFIIRTPTGQIRTIGNPYRHSRTVENTYPQPPETPPKPNSSGTYQVVAEGILYEDIVNVSRVTCGVFELHHSDGTRTQTTEITDVSGPLYTLVAKHAAPSEYGTTVTSTKRSLGVYVTEADDCLPDGVPALRTVGHPDSAAVCKTPKSYRISRVDALESLCVKTPNGDILTSTDDVLWR